MYEIILICFSLNAQRSGGSLSTLIAQGTDNTAQGTDNTIQRVPFRPNFTPGSQSFASPYLFVISNQR